MAASNALAEIQHVLAELPLLTWSGKSSDPKCVIAQAMLNAYIRESFKEWGWHKEYIIKNANKYRHFLDFYKSFAQGEGAPPLRVGIEVEFGYHARIDTDIRKFQTAFQKNTIDVGVIVCLTEVDAGLAGRGVACFEALVENLADFTESTITCPILAIGLSRQNTCIVDLSLSHYPCYKALTGKTSVKEKRRTVHALKRGVPVAKLGPKQQSAPVNVVLHADAALHVTQHTLPPLALTMSPAFFSHMPCEDVEC
ncbi:MAG: BglII/BstYI family type II restriction endonuclease [Agitococcus sp.]|nr:BglII/BstYI family type II restriction endonuclease [Agitococcus sp.]MDO9179079.1 BglII/BstYI family type II restriction endonuclease [Agitococcus sp.]